MNTLIQHKAVCSSSSSSSSSRPEPLGDNLHWFSKSITCIPYREKDCLKLYVTEFFFFWKIFVTWRQRGREGARWLMHRGEKKKESAEDFYHEEVVEQEDLPLVQTQLLGLVWIWNFKQAAVTHQPAMGQRQHLHVRGTDSTDSNGSNV